MFGIGFSGSGPYKGKQSCPMYRRWRNMLSRCYYPKSISYEFYGGAGVTVCPSWHNFQNYARWLHTEFLDMGYTDLSELSEFHVDKDLKIKGNKIYSPDTCKLVKKEINTGLAHLGSGKTASFEHSTKGTVENINIHQFAKSQNINYSLIWKLVHGKSKTCHGWKLLKEEKS